MAGAVFLEQDKASAIQEAMQTVEGLLGESERLTRAQHDVTGRSMPDYVSAMLVAELVRVVTAQEERIKKLEARPMAEDAEEE